MRKSAIIFGCVIGIVAGVAAAYFSTRRTWLGDVPPGMWLENLSQLNALAPLIGYSLIGGLAGGGIGWGVAKK